MKSFILLLILLYFNWTNSIIIPNQCEIENQFCKNESNFNVQSHLIDDDQNQQNLFPKMDDNYVVQMDDIYYPEDGFDLHICTRRPCNCYIANCYAYCMFNWCFNSPTQDSVFFPCEQLKTIAECRYLIWPCKNYC